MKKTISLLLLILLLPTMCACRKTPETPTKPTTEPTVPTTEPLPEQRQMYAVSLPSVSLRDYAADEVCIFDYVYQNMHLVHPDASVAEIIIADFQQKVASTKSDADAIHASAKKDYVASSNWHFYYYHYLFNATRVDASLLSLSGTIYSSSSTYRQDRVGQSLTYDMLTGKHMLLGDVIISGKGAALTTLVLDALGNIAEEYVLYEFYQNYVTQQLAELARYSKFYFTNDGLAFYFDPGEIAGIASRTITVTIPYGSLTGILKDDYFPPETEDNAGAIFIKKFSDVNQNDFTQIAEVVTDENSQMRIIYTDLTIGDVTVYVSPSNYIGTDMRYTLFATKQLTPGDAIVLQLPENMYPRLTLTYESGGKTITRKIL